MKNPSALADKLAKIRAEAQARLVPPNPIKKLPVMAGVKLTGNLEKDAPAQLDAMQRSYRDKVKLIGKQKTDTLDSEYWVCLCFQSRDQKEAYLRAKGWIYDGDKYLDGTVIASREKIPLPSAKIKFRLESPSLRDIPRIGKE